MLNTLLKNKDKKKEPNNLEPTEPSLTSMWFQHLQQLFLFLHRYQSEPDLSLAVAAGIRPEWTEEKSILPMVSTWEDKPW